jgi:hypothetical protein
MGEIDNKLLFRLISCFVAATIIATIVHEYGHFFTAKFLGYDARVSYGFTTWTNSGYQDFIDSLTRDERIKIRTNEYFARKDEYESLLKRIKDETFLITLGGPLLTIIMGSLGIAVAFINKKKFNEDQLSAGQWLIVFTALFWLREPANYIIDLLITIQQGRFPNRNDEAILSRYLEVDSWLISFVLAVTGLILVVIVYRKFIPDQDKTTFLLAGLIGGLGGYLLWLFFFGPVLMP